MTLAPDLSAAWRGLFACSVVIALTACNDVDVPDDVPYAPRTGGGRSREIEANTAPPPGTGQGQGTGGVISGGAAGVAGGGQAGTTGGADDFSDFFFGPEGFATAADGNTAGGFDTSDNLPPTTGSGTETPGGPTGTGFSGRNFGGVGTGTASGAGPGTGNFSAGIAGFGGIPTGTRTNGAGNVGGRNLAGGGTTINSNSAGPNTASANTGSNVFGTGTAAGANTGIGTSTGTGGTGGGAGDARGGNRAPVASIAFDPPCLADDAEQAEVTLVSTATDPDGDELRCIWEMPAAIPGAADGCIVTGISFLSGVESEVLLVVDDGRGGTATAVEPFRACADLAQGVAP